MLLLPHGCCLVEVQGPDHPGETAHIHDRSDFYIAAALSWCRYTTTLLKTTLLDEGPGASMLLLPHCAASSWCRYMATLLKKALLDEKAKVPSIEGWEDSSVGAILQTILKHMLIILGPTKRLNELVREALLCPEEMYDCNTESCICCVPCLSLLGSTAAGLSAGQLAQG